MFKILKKLFSTFFFFAYTKSNCKIIDLFILFKITDTWEFFSESLFQSVNFLKTKTAYDTLLTQQKINKFRCYWSMNATLGENIFFIFNALLIHIFWKFLYECYMCNNIFEISIICNDRIRICKCIFLFEIFQCDAGQFINIDTLKILLIVIFSCEMLFKKIFAI